MRNKRYRPIFFLAFMTLMTAFKCISLMDKYPVRPIVAVFFVALGGLIGATIFSVVEMTKEKNNDKNPDKLS